MTCTYIIVERAIYTEIVIRWPQSCPSPPFLCILVNTKYSMYSANVSFESDPHICLVAQISIKLWVSNLTVLFFFTWNTVKILHGGHNRLMQLTPLKILEVFIWGLDRCKSCKTYFCVKNWQGLHRLKLLVTCDATATSPSLSQWKTLPVYHKFLWALFLCTQLNALKSAWVWCTVC